MTSQTEVAASKKEWLRIKARSYRFLGGRRRTEDVFPSELAASETENKADQSGPMFKNPFQIEDLAVFDDATMREMLRNSLYGLSARDLAIGLTDAPAPIIAKIKRNLPYRQRAQFRLQQQHKLFATDIKTAQQNILDNLFWELTYWKTPELYEELTEGENLHPGIFRNLKPFLTGKTILDAGAGSGRASFECLRYGAKQVFALEPSPGLLHILEQKLADQPKSARIMALRGRFDNIPLESNSVDVALACSAFTAEAAQGG